MYGTGMRKNPWFLTFLKLAIWLAILFFIIMLWWSSQSLEQEMLEVKGSLEQIQEKLKRENRIVQQPLAAKEAPFRQWDPALPNLLQEDLYYEKTLPEQLGPHFIPSGTRRGATLGKPDNLHPFSNWVEVSNWYGMCTVSLTRLKFGIYETLAPDMAIKMEERGNPPEYWIHLREGVFWQPLDPKWFPAGFNLAPQFLQKHPVTAHDYKFFFDVMKNPAVAEAKAVALRTILGDIEEVRVVDDLTLVVKWNKPKYVSKQLSGSLSPLPEFVYQYFQDGTKIIEEDQDPDTYRKNPVFALNFTNHWAKNIIVSCGAWIFDGMTDRMIRFKRNQDHYFPYDALSAASEIEIKSSPDTVWQDFKEGKMETYLLRPEKLLELNQFLQSPAYEKQVSQASGIERLDYIARAYEYIGWNQARDLFRSKKVRQALTLAIDRQRIIRQTLNGLGVETHGTFHPESPASDPSLKPWPFDPQKAKRMLEEEGWYDSKGDGIISKEINGKWMPFQFSLTYFVKNPTSKSTAEYIATALKPLGIRVDLNGVDIADLTKLFEDKDFDALLMGWALSTPPEEPRQLWYSKEADKKGSSNAVGFKNQEADEIIDRLDFEKDPEKRIALYHRFDAILHEEQPYTFLYTPKNSLLYRQWLKNVFIPEKRQDLVPGANVTEPDLGVAWIEK